jgi:hypothetical protein
MPVKFCTGSPVCSECGGAHRQGVIQNCPTPLRDFAYASVAAGAPVVKAPKSGLGDLAAEFFASLGVTPKTYQATKESLHLPGGCGCDKRKRLLNAVGEKLGVNEAAAAMANWLKGRTQTPSA